MRRVRLVVFENGASVATCVIVRSHERGIVVEFLNLVCTRRVFLYNHSEVYAIAREMKADAQTSYSRILMVYPEFPVTYWGFQCSLPLIDKKAVDASSGTPYNRCDDSFRV